MDIHSILEAEGYTVLGPFTSVKKALNLVKDTRPDAVVLNYSVRGKAIAPVAKRLRALDVPMVLSSADYAINAPLSEVCETLAGAKSIGKPFNERRLLDALSFAFRS
jgi:DNA-binding response OmpR family regulator